MEHFPCSWMVRLNGQNVAILYKFMCEMNTPIEILFS